MRHLDILGRQAQVRIGVIGAALTACIAVVLSGSSARADEKGFTVSHTVKPFTESVRAMMQRDSMRPRPPKDIIVAPPERDDELLERKKVDPTAPEAYFKAPPFKGRTPGRMEIMSLGAGFTGLKMADEFSSFGTAYIPPDTTGAVGPSHYVETINGGVAIYNKSTGARLSFVSANSFFAISGVFPSSGTGTSDPRVVYDRRSGHWFACMIDTKSSANLIGLAVSRTSDPTGVWDKYSFVAGDATHFCDYESMALDDNGVYFGGTLFSGGSPRVFATPKASLIAASPSLGTVTAFSPASMYSTPQPALNYDSVGPTGRAWFVAASDSAWGNVNYLTVTWSGTTPTFSSTQVLTTPAYGAGFPTVNTSGSADPVEIGDDRIMHAVIRNGHLWLARNVGCDSSGGSTNFSRLACEWMEIDVTAATASLVQSGRIYDPSSTPRHYFYPSIMVNGQGHASIAYSGTKSTEFIGCYLSQRLKTDASGTMNSITTIQAGTNSYDVTFGSGRNRWGDYSFTTLDPADDMTIWTIQEYATTPPASSSSGGWATWITRATPPAPTLNNPNGTGMQGQTGVALNLTGTGLYDPGAGFANRLQVQLAGGATNGISNYSVTFNSPTSVKVMFDIASNASTGTRDIVLTNPDGQSVTVTGGFTVTSSSGSPHASVTPNPASATVPHDGDPNTKSASLTLDGSGSTDPNNLALSYTWKDGSSNVVGTSATLPLSLQAGSYSYSLTVTNTNSLSDTVSVPVTINPEPNSSPSANAGPDQNVPATGSSTSVTMAGSGSDPDGDTLTYTWTEGATPMGNGATPTISLSTGTHTLKLTVTDPYGASASDTVVITVTASTTLTVPDVAGAVGGSVTLSATLASGGTGISGKAVTIKVDGVEVPGSPATTDGSGAASVNYALTEGTVGTHTISASFSGDGSYPAASGSGTLTVAKSDTTLVAANATGDAGQTVTLSATLTRNSDGAAINGKTVTFKVNGSGAGSGATDASGVASVTYTIPSGTAGGQLPITADFAADANYSASTGNSTLTVRIKTALTIANATTTYGANVTLKATLKGNGVALSGKTVTFLVDGNVVGSGLTNSSGVATAVHAANETVGTHVLTAQFAGDADYAACTSPNGTLTVNKGITKLTVANVSAKYKAKATLKATLKSGSLAIPNATVTFKIDGTLLGTATTDGSGLASISHIVTETVGTHTITAEYAGDATYQASTGSGTLTVQLATTKITADVLKKPGNSAVVYGAKLVRTTDATPLAGMQLDFFDAATNTLLGSGVTDSNGRATINTTSPATGVKKTITVKFAGDSLNAASAGTGSITGI